MENHVESFAADLILVNGKIVTVDEDFRITEAIAVNNGRILAVGISEDIEKWKGDQTDVIDLEDRMVLPGLIDSHLHMVNTGISFSLINCRTPPMESIANILAAVKEKVSEVNPG